MKKDAPKKLESRLWIGVSVIFVLAAVLLRFLLLDNKPIHFDESINMWFVKRIIEDGYFTYDPTNYHGPLYFYLVHFMTVVMGFDFLATRWTSSIFSFLTLIILWFGPVGQRRALRWAAVFLLLSPAMGFYGRSGIHEAVFVFFQVLGFLSFHYLVAKDFKKFWWTFTAGLLGMMALKETFVILILAWIPAAALGWYLGRDTQPLKKWYSEIRQSLQQESVYTPLVFMVLIFVGLFMGFGGHPRGILDFFVALMPWLKTGVHGAGHEKEFLHWSKLMGQYEFAIVAGFFLSLTFLRKNKWIPFYAVFAVINWLIYSLIPYKTPWCIISLLWPFAVLAGFGIDELQTRVPKMYKHLIVTGVAIVLVFEFVQMDKIEFRDPIDMDHPYVYVNSTYQMKEFISKIQGMLRADPLLRERVMQIGAEESWPFPIVFAGVYNLNYQKYSIEVVKDAILYIVDDKDKVDFELKLAPNKNLYQNFLLETRQGRAKTLVYVRRDLFQKVFSWPLSELGVL